MNYTNNEIISFVGKAQRKIALLSRSVRDKSLDGRNYTEDLQLGLELIAFVEVINSQYTDLDVNEILRVVHYYLRKANLSQGSSIPIPAYVIEVDPNTIPPGTYVTYPDLNVVDQNSIDRDDDLQAQIDAVNLRIDNLDLSSFFPPGFFDDIAYKTDLHNHTNKTVLDQIVQNDLDTIDLAIIHMANTAIHVSPTDRTNWDNKASLPITIANVTSLQTTLTNLQNQINLLPIPGPVGPAGQDGQDGQDGAQGPQGEAFHIDAEGEFAERSNYISEDKGFTFLDIGNGVLYIKLLDGTDNWSNPIPFLGPKGWTPSLAIDTIDNRQVIRLADYIGGDLPKPTTFVGYYLSETGWVVDPADATDIRGLQGVFRVDQVGDYDTYVANQVTWLASQPLGFSYLVQGETGIDAIYNGFLYIVQQDGAGPRYWRELHLGGGGGGSGHIIKDETTTYTQQSNLKFVNFEVTNASPDTVITAKLPISEEFTYVSGPQTFTLANESLATIGVYINGTYIREGVGYTLTTTTLTILTSLTVGNTVDIVYIPKNAVVISTGIFEEEFALEFE